MRVRRTGMYKNPNINKAEKPCGWTKFSDKIQSSTIHEKKNVPIKRK